MSVALAEALSCAARGWPVVPVRGKNPGGFVGRGWQDKATTDPAMLRPWWRRWPDANPGVVVGESFLAFDIDRRRGDDDRLHALEQELGEIPTTPSYTTGDGWRVLFEHPGGELRHEIDGIEVKHSCQMVVVPGSVHPETGRLYEWDEHPDEVPLAPLPEAWLRRLAAPVRSCAPARAAPGQVDFLRGLAPSRYVKDLADVSASPGETLRCVLPDHEDRTPSFHVYPTPEGGWFCFGCRRGGSIFDLAGCLAGYEPPLRGVPFLEVEAHLLSFYESRLAA